MKKNFLQDVIPANQRRSIRDIPLPPHRSAPSKSKSKKPKSEPAYEQPEPIVPTPVQYTYEEKEQVFNPHTIQEADFSHEQKEIKNKNHEQEPPHYSYSSNKRSSPFKKILLGIAFGALIFLGVLVLRTQATIEIHPKQNSYPIEVVIPVASPEVAQTQLTKSASVTLQASSEQQVEKKATGKIKITNYHATTPQELVKNTRFKSPDGLIYTIKDPISIPGFTDTNGTVIPGTLEVEVVASNAGEEYNIEKTSFTIPGFEGQSQFDKITAQSITEMTGGYIGIKKVVSEDAKADASEQLKNDILKQFQSGAIISDTNVVLADTNALTYGELKDSIDGDSITLTLEGTAKAYSFKKQDLSNIIARKSISDATDIDTFEVDLSALSLSIEDSVIVAKGNTTIKWKTDIEKLKADIAGKKKSEVETIVNSFPSLDKTNIKLHPFWKIRIPTDVNKINIEIIE